MEVAADRSADTVKVGPLQAESTEPAPVTGVEGRAGEPTASAPQPEPEPSLAGGQARSDSGPADDVSGAPAERQLLDRSRVPLLAILGTLLVGAVVASVFLGRSVVQASHEAKLRTEALQTARQLVVNFTTVDHRSVTKSTSGVLALSAGDFHQQYANAAKDLQKLVEQNQTTSRGKVLDVGIVSFDPDSARVLVIADADVTNVSTKKPQLRTYRLQLDLSRQGSTWRVVELQFVG